MAYEKALNTKDIKGKNEIEKLNNKFTLVSPFDAYSLRTLNHMYECYVDDNVNHLLTSDCTAQEPPT